MVLVSILILLELLQYQKLHALIEYQVSLVAYLEQRLTDGQGEIEVAASLQAQTQLDPPLRVARMLVYVLRDYLLRLVELLLQAEVNDLEFHYVEFELQVLDGAELLEDGTDQRLVLLE